MSSCRSGARSARTVAHRAALLLVALLVAGCAAIHRPSATVRSLMRDAAEAAELERATADSIVDRLARRAVARGDRTLDILLLSGGGQNGAYGAGFLRGWKARPDSPMPSFDLVTGVSTGALQAPFAFLGSESALDTLATLYRRSADSFAPTLDWWFWLRRTGGVVNTRRLRSTLDVVLDRAMRDRLAGGVAEGRQLVIGTTDMDLGVGHTWDVGSELASGDSALARVRTLLLASSSIPGIFPPQVIDGRVHADGGVIANLLPGLSLPQYRRLGRQLQMGRDTTPVTVRLWVIMNVWAHAPVTVMNPADRKAMSARTNSLLFWAQQPQLLQRLQELTGAVNGEVEGLRMELHFTAIPDAMSSEPGAAALFNSAFLLRLEGEGYARARSAAPWDAEPPSPYRRSH